MNSTRTRNIIIIGVVAFVVVVGYFVLFSGKTKTISCELQDTEPQPVGDLEKLIPLIDSKNGLALAKIEGYLKYRLEPHINQTYLPLNVEQLRYFEHRTELRFGGEDECVTIHMGLDRSVSGVVTINNLYIELYKPVGQLKTCSIFPNIDPLAKNKKHYRCADKQAFACTTTTKDPDGKDITVTIADFVINYLEVELDGDESLISQGKFSTEPFECTKTVIMQ